MNHFEDTSSPGKRDERTSGTVGDVDDELVRAEVHSLELKTGTGSSGESDVFGIERLFPGHLAQIEAQLADGIHYLSDILDVVR